MPDSQESQPPVARLAAKVAHELNNPLDAVLRFVSLAQRKVQSGQYADVERHLSDANFGLQKMAEIIRQLMNDGEAPAGQLPTPDLHSVAELLSNAVRTTSAQAEQKSVRVSIDNQLAATADPRFDLRLSQVLANLLKNAIEAAPEQSLVQVQIKPISPRRFSLSITDDGPGIDPTLLPRLFTPFVTTKVNGSGHGLGLAISRELVLAIGGTMTAENHSPQGCIITIILPLPV